MKPAVAAAVVHNGVPRLRALALLASLLGAMWATAAASREVTQRPLRVDDLFALQGFGADSRGTAPVAIAQDGAVAFIETRAVNSLPRFPIGWDVPTIMSNSDVWVQIATADAPRNLTHGDVDATGWWRPEWSPDGRYLALLSTRGGDATLWVWSRERNELRQLSSRNVDTMRTRAHAIVWTDDRHVLCSLLPAGEPGGEVRYATGMPRGAPAGWEKKIRAELSASVLQSGVPTPVNERAQGDLVSIDVATGVASVVAAGDVRDFELAPTGRAVAFFRPTGAFEFDPGEILNQNTAVETCALAVVDLQGRRLLRETIANAVPASVRWAPNSDQLAFLVYGERRDQPQKIGRVDLQSGSLAQVALADATALPVIRDATLERPELEWTARGDLLIAVAQLADRSERTATPRRDWWLVEGTQRRSITTGMRSVPRQLRRDPVHPDAMLGVADGELWRLSVASGTAQNLTGKLSAPVLRWISPPDTSLDPRAHRPGRLALEVRAQDGNGRDYVVFDVATDAVETLPKPEAEALLSAYSSANDTAIFSASNFKGAHLWRYSQVARRTEALMSANTFLRDIAPGELQRFEYRSLDGQVMQAWILLPPDYIRGKRYPLLSCVYGGLVYGAESPALFTDVDTAAFVNMRVLAAQGYAVLFPSMPLGRLGTAGDPMLALAGGVLPAIDKAIELGIADGERLFVAGHSYGGYSTYGLITQTPRFKAAVAMAGASNLISGYGVFDVNLRYRDDAHLPHREGSWLPAWAESGQGGMGGPPWRDVARYARNSPVFSVDRVQTPVMIVQGDLDVVSMQQGEEFFTGLYRQGKRAQFVRYWGEGHNIETPGNVRDLWTRVFAWLDEFGDVARDEHGAVLWDGNIVRSRRGQPALTPGQFLQIERFFEPAAVNAKRH